MEKSLEEILQNEFKRNSEGITTDNYTENLKKYIAIGIEVKELLTTIALKKNKSAAAISTDGLIDITNIVFTFLRGDIPAGLQQTLTVSQAINQKPYTARIYNLLKLVKQLKPKGYLHEFIYKFDCLTGNIYRIISKALNADNNKTKNQNCKKLSVDNLILKFDKVRFYLSILMNNNNINKKKDFYNKCSGKSASSCEKDTRRICDLFGTNDILKLATDFKNYSQNEFAKIYDIHTVPNLISNLLILDILYKHKNENLKVEELLQEIFLNEFEYDNKDKKQNINEKYNTFRKYTLLPRLKELAQYGFIKINNNKYSLVAKYPTESQIKIIKKFIPIVFIKYPFKSIGHFIMTRFKIKSEVNNSSYDMRNILDDCITFDIFSAIHQNKPVTLEFINKEKQNIIPKEFITDKNGLLKIIDEKLNEYFINEIDSVNYKNKKDNLIFSEIHCFYYQIVQDLIIEYGKKKQYNTDNIYTEYKKIYNHIINKQKIKDIASLTVGLQNVVIPLTTLELRWLKTVMQDAEFDKYVTSEEKDGFEKLVEDVKPFDLSVFKGFQI